MNNLIQKIEFVKRPLAAPGSDSLANASSGVGPNYHYAMFVTTENEKLIIHKTADINLTIQRFEVISYLEEQKEYRINIFDENNIKPLEDKYTVLESRTKEKYRLPITVKQIQDAAENSDKKEYNLFNNNCIKAVNRVIKYLNGLSVSEDGKINLINLTLFQKALTLFSIQGTSYQIIQKNLANANEKLNLVKELYQIFGKHVFNKFLIRKNPCDPDDPGYIPLKQDLDKWATANKKFTQKIKQNEKKCSDAKLQDFFSLFFSQLGRWSVDPKFDKQQIVDIFCSIFLIIAQIKLQYASPKVAILFSFIMLMVYFIWIAMDEISSGKKILKIFGHMLPFLLTKIISKSSVSLPYQVCRALYYLIGFIQNFIEKWCDNELSKKNYVHLLGALIGCVFGLIQGVSGLSFILSKFCGAIIGGALGVASATLIIIFSDCGFFSWLQKKFQKNIRPVEN